MACARAATIDAPDEKRNLQINMKAQHGGCHGKKAQNLFANGQWRSQPDNLVALCKFKIIIIIQFFRN